MRVDPENLSTPPDGRPLELAPQWRRDFPIDVPRDTYVARRDFAKFMVLTSFAFAVGQVWIVVQNLLRRRTGALPVRAVARAAEVPVGGSVSFAYPDADHPAVAQQVSCQQQQRDTDNERAQQREEAADHAEAPANFPKPDGPGEGQRFRDRLMIPAALVDTVFKTAIAACRARTLAHLPLPPGERFDLEYVKDTPWNAYNWYKGNYRSLIQVNLDFPIPLDRAVDLACHEGYPGHHVYSALQEYALMRGRGWVEISLYPLFSPKSLIAEGSANFGIDMAFPSTERVAFEIFFNGFFLFVGKFAVLVEFFILHQIGWLSRLLILYHIPQGG